MKHKDGGISYFTYEAKEENPDIVLSKAKESFVVREDKDKKIAKGLVFEAGGRRVYLEIFVLKVIR